MFVIEKYIEDKRAAIQAWEEKRDKWVSEGSEYDYRHKRMYSEHHPRPGDLEKKILKITLTIIVAAAFLLCVFGGISHVHIQDNNKHKSSTSQEKPVKKDYKVDDKVQVVYGSYENSVGVVVKANDDDAIIKLTDSTLTHKMCDAQSDCSEGGGKDNGELLSISSYKNLVPYKETK